ncbi:amidohydrolase family protein [Christensenellaceae bacterium OttesenSCG-928-K19]|nr:amidohydrolase family protein [Christensenellaceae bacterium OttesenSCG-928-K19]
MMKVDIHTHLWPCEETSKELVNYFASRGIDIERTLSADGLVASMKGVAELAVIATLAPAGNTSNADLVHFHEYVMKHTRQYPGKLMALCTIDPHNPRESLDYLADYIENKGFCGLKLHQNIQEFYPNDSALFPIYAKMQEYGLPILFHTGGIGIAPFIDKYSNVEALEEVACNFPSLPIIMGHAGRGQYVDTASILRKHKNVYADISANFGKLAGSEHLILSELVKTVKLWTGSVDKLLFGSDYPFYYGNPTLDLLERLPLQEPDFITQEDVRKIAEENAYAFLHKHILDNPRFTQN